MARDGQDKDFHLAFRPGSQWLRAQVTGTSSAANTLAYWQEIVDEVARHRPACLLLVDELQGQPLSPAEWAELVDSLPLRLFRDVRIAHVKPHGLQKLEYCELYAREVGLTARVFDGEREAELWLRYGEE